MEVVAFAMGAVGFVELVLKTWDAIEKKKHENKEAKLFALELKQFGLPERREALKLDLELSQKILQDRSTDQTTKNAIAESFKRLSEQLEAIVPKLDMIVEIGHGVLNSRKRSAAVKELRTMVENFSKSGTNFHEMVGGFRQITLSESSLLLSEPDLKIIGSEPDITKLAEDGTLYYTKVSYAVQGTGSGIRDVLFETRLPNDRFTEKESRALASKLHHALPSWNIPRLIGYRENLDLVFDRPNPSKEIKTLSRIYTDITTEPSLNIRLRLCYELATAVLQTHTPLGLVHKNIRPDNLLVTYSADGGSLTQATLFLSGWQHARGLDGHATNMIGESIARKAIYQHPHRQTRDGKPATNQYCIGHDIYSLGVCILELLTWEPIIRNGDEGDELSLAFRQTFNDLGFNANLPEERDARSEAELLTADSKEVQATLVQISKTLIGQRAGDKLAELAVKCLKCLDLDPSFGNYVTGGTDKNSVTASFASDVFDVFDKTLSVV
ncbi:hypothetical protein IFR05_002248 [Cadophora sp. M221]|nr:hypothetical protein IFR05_002248 [Cadophora sp. M221]